MDQNIAGEIRLLQASIKGSSDDFERLVTKYQSLVCAITYSATGDIEKSEELAQETFVRAWKNLTQLRDQTRFKFWLCSIAKSTIKNHFRDRKRDIISKAGQITDASSISSSASDPAQNLIAKEQQAVVDQALQALPESYRQPLILFYRQEQSTTQVADLLDLTEDNVRTRLSRGRKMLKQQVTAMIENSLSNTAPGKAFTAVVMASVTGIAIKAAAAAAAQTTASASSSTAATAGTLAAITGGIVAKILIAAAIIVIGVSAVATYKHFANKKQTPSQLHLVKLKNDQSNKTEYAQNTDAENTPGNVTQIPATADLATASNEQPQQTNPLADAPDSDLAEDQEYEFTPNGVLSGLVTDIQTGQPVTDASIQMYNTNGRIFSAKTDENGFYSMKDIQAGGSHEISINSNEYLGITVGSDQPVIQLEKGGQAIKHFQLHKACVIDLHVVDEEGNAVKAATVIPTSPSDSKKKPINYSGGTKETDENGYLQLGGFKSSETDYLITAWHRTSRKNGRKHDFSPGKAFVKLTDPNVIQSVEIVLEKGMKIQGFAQYSDAVVASDVRISAKPDWWHCNYYGYDEFKVDQDGTFELDYIVPGTYKISAHISRADSSGGYSFVVKQAKLPLPEGELLSIVVPLKSPDSLVSISGTIKYVGPKKPNYVDVATYSPIHGHGRGTVKYENGKVGNSFAVDRLEPGKYTVKFSGSDMEQVILKDVEAPCDDLEVELVYMSKPKIECIAVDLDTGDVIKDFRGRPKKVKTLRGPSYVQKDQWHFSSAKDGNLNIEVVGPGTYQVQIAANGYSPKWSSIINTDNPEIAVVELSRGSSISGIVVSENGQPVNGAKVMALSYCQGNTPRTSNCFVIEKNAAKTVKGLFTLNDIPQGTETLKITHPDYLFRIVEDIEVVAGQATEDIQVVLSKGATVEGYVYDADGKPVNKATVFFQDSSRFDYGDGDSGRYGVAVTDSKGFYSVTRIPAKMCYARRKEEWRTLGVVLQTVIPETGKMNRLDFGGLPLLTGTVVLEGIPAPDLNLRLASTQSRYSGDFLANARTDSDGNFIFRGVAPGKHAIYYVNPEKRGDFIKLKNIKFKYANMDVGITPEDIHQLELNLDESVFGATRKITQISLSEPDKLFGQTIFMSTKRTKEGEPWVINNVDPGDYIMCILFSDQMQIRRPLSLDKDKNEWSINIDLPKSKSSISGIIIGKADNVYGLWKEDASVICFIHPGDDGSYKVESIPAGKYVIGNYLSLLAGVCINMLDGTAGGTKFELKNGQYLVLDVDLSETDEDKMGYLQVKVLDENGRPLADVDIEIIGDTATAKPYQSSEKTHAFIAPPGKYTLIISADGYKTIQKEIKLAVIEMGSAKPKATIINLKKQ